MGGARAAQNAYTFNPKTLSVEYIAADKREIRDGFRWVLQRVGQRRVYVKQRITAWAGPHDAAPRQALCSAGERRYGETCSADK